MHLVVTLRKVDGNIELSRCPRLLLAYFFPQNLKDWVMRGSCLLSFFYKNVFLSSLNEWVQQVNFE